MGYMSFSMSLCFIDSKIPGIIRCRLNSKILRMKRVFILIDEMQ